MRLVGLTVIALLASRAAADPRVVIVETDDAPALPALATQVRVHGGRALEVTTRREHTTAFAEHAFEIPSMQPPSRQRMSLHDSVPVHATVQDVVAAAIETSLNRGLQIADRSRRLDRGVTSSPGGPAAGC